MMLQLDHVTKQYGAYTAVLDLSFSAAPGQVIGLLGRNGAGKSTIMNMIAGYLSPTSGQLLWNGMDTLRLGGQFLAEVGYLPEIPPLYPEMTVQEMLRYACGLKKIRRQAQKQHIESVLAMTHLESHCRVLIRNLSKGYRQRVGLAIALIGNPTLILLDEPTVGLDPEQLVAFRELILGLQQDHAIIISSHVLSEIESMCSHLAVIRKGRLAAFGTASSLMAESGRSAMQLRLRVRDRQAVPVLQSIDGVSFVEKECDLEEGWSDYLLHSTQDVTEAVLACVQTQHLPLKMLIPVEETLERVFLRLTDEEEAE